MLDQLGILTGIPEEVLIREYKEIHQRYHNTEQPFATLELDSILQRYPGLNRAELAQTLSPAFEAFNETRRKTLLLYPTVEATLQRLAEKGVQVVGHTEAVVHNSHLRLKYLGINHYFTHLYTLKGKVLPHPNVDRLMKLDTDAAYIVPLPDSERKPNPQLVLDICQRHGIRCEEAVYVGDSITRDISMAIEAGVDGVWARYGRNFDSRLWDFLVQITHWSENDVRAEMELREKYGQLNPEFTVDQYGDILDIFEF
jgi:phosphoglycolate phosphatase-like HAD superfamily hydrolase